MGRQSWLGGVAVVAAALALLLGQSSALAASLYATGSVGYDISYPQCGTNYPSGAFGIIGVNAGYPFTYYNSCFGTEWTYAQATAGPSLYINTGYDPSYTTVDSRHSTQACVNQSTAIAGTSAQNRAWAVGCSEAERSVEYASCGDNVIPSTCSTIVKTAAWWLDVETGNSWCGRPGTKCKDLTLNQYTLQGVVDTLQTSGENPAAAPVGVYSTPAQWTTIVGSHPVKSITADWRATGVTSESAAASSCSASGFTGSSTPLWLVQFLPGSYDADYAC